MRINLQRMTCLALALLAACLAQPAPLPSPETSTTEQALQSCSDNCDCPHGSYCANHQCVGDFGPFAPCYCATRDCVGGGPICNLVGATGGGFCSSSCDSDCDCEHGSVCRNGRCEGDFGPLAPCYCGARDCATPGQTCVNGFCNGGGGGGGGGLPTQQ